MTTSPEPVHFTTDSDSTSRAPIHPLEWLAVLCLVVLADITIYRGQGYAGLAAFVAGVPLFLILGTRKLPRTVMSFFLAGLLCLAALKLLWSGTALITVYGLALIAGFAMELSGLRPFVLDVLVFGLHIIKAGFLRGEDYFLALKQTKWVIPQTTLIRYVLPALAVAGFGTIFVLANPDVSRQTGEWLQWAARFLGDSVSRFVPTWSEGLFWLVMACVFAGLIKPAMTHSVLAWFCLPSSRDNAESIQPQEAELYPAFTNTLIAVIVLFAVYLVFEFQTLWFREFPEGFHYSGYAHRGAAWLTIALALATLLLSVMFRADVMQDSRLPKLKRLAWIWSVLNLCLAVAVYHRLMIYVGFNGMTRMRVVGFLGISAVVAGFLLVVRKITNGQGFVWLIRRQLWVVAFAGFLYAVMPVDALVHRYNVRRILEGDFAPSVQLSVHPMDSGGLIELVPLLESENTIIREGVAALLTEKAFDFRFQFHRTEPPGWTGFQWADKRLAERLELIEAEGKLHQNQEESEEAFETFRAYAYQWY